MDRSWMLGLAGVAMVVACRGEGTGDGGPGPTAERVDRAAVIDDVVYSAAELSALTERAGTAKRDVAVEKAELLTVTDPRGFPNDDDPANIPDQYAKDEAGQLFFRRPDIGRTYYVVVADSAPAWVFDAFELATSDIEAALPSDCLESSVFTPILRSAYEQLDPVARALGYEIEVEYSSEACNGQADGCANLPRLQAVDVSPSTSETRMRLGSYIGLESDYDSPTDADTAADLTAANARDIVLHELSHTLGFQHPRYTLEPDVVPADIRVPSTSQGTLPTFMLPTSNRLGLFSPRVTAEDRRALAQTYGGDCSFTNDFRPIGQACSLQSEQRCLQHGGSCEATPAGNELCRWPHFTDESSCSTYSYGSWQTVDVPLFEGQCGACAVDASSLLECLPGSSATTPEDYAGRCCTQFDGKPGVMFPAFADTSSTTFYCSDQKDLWAPLRGNWEFVNAAEQSDFTPLDAGTGASTTGWQVSSGDYTQSENRTSNLTFSNFRLKSGCVSTHVTAPGAGESGIVFNYVNAQSYYVFDVTPNERRRIRRVLNGESTSLSDIPLAHAATWAAGITLMVCFGDGIHTFIDDRAGSNVHVDTTVSFIGTGGRIGLWNGENQAARHAYLRSFPLVHGFSRLQ